LLGVDRSAKADYGRAVAKRASASKRSAAAAKAPPAPDALDPAPIARGDGSAVVRSIDSAPGAGGGDPSAPEFEGQYRVSLPAFEGPLDLLLHLIQQHEIDILNIPVSFITEKYLTYLTLMRSLSIDIASEYLVMAATLVHIKSKMLLPSVPAGQEDDSVLGEDEEDPRAELVRRLLEYQKYKAAAAELGERGTLGKDVFMRGVPEPEPEGIAPFAPMGVFSLLDAFEKVLKRTKVKLDHEVVFDRISITDRIVELTEKLSERRSMRFEELVMVTPDGGAPTRFDLVITFLAVLEMARLKLVKVYQAGPLEPIHLQVGDGPPPNFEEKEPEFFKPEGVPAVEPVKKARAPKRAEAPPVEEVSAPEVTEVQPVEEASAPEPQEAVLPEETGEPEPQEGVVPEETGAPEAQEAVVPEETGALEPQEAAVPEVTPAPEPPEALEPEEAAVPEEPPAPEAPEAVAPEAVAPAEDAIEEAPETPRATGDPNPEPIPPPMDAEADAPDPLPTWEELAGEQNNPDDEDPQPGEPDGG
jgi:segregation and condensation protein A